MQLKMYQNLRPNFLRPFSVTIAVKIPIPSNLSKKRRKSARWCPRFYTLNQQRGMESKSNYFVIIILFCCCFNDFMYISKKLHIDYNNYLHNPFRNIDLFDFILYNFFQAVGGIGPKLITTLIVWGAYPTWGSVIFPPLDIPTTLAHNSTTVAARNINLACNGTYSALTTLKNFNCTAPSNITGALSTFTCNYLKS